MAFQPHWILAGSFIALALGCSSSEPPEKSTANANRSKPRTPNWTTVTLHIDGFKKSKSGAT
ncbi:MAG: hypothetical protein Tsb009_20370 [Planctomycetaceae bacterium]